ncbi:MAG TPA: hypothetical protein DCS43_03190 [Verrucomicrobia bacterium]|nr:hypothetical protein [Verrucomicrobiota bacterium]
MATYNITKAGRSLVTREGGLAAFFTAALFLVLPYVHLIVPPPAERVALLDIPRVALPPPVVPPPPSVEPLQETADPVVFPVLSEPMVQSMALASVLDFDVAIGNVGLDGAVSFRVEPLAVTMDAGGAFALEEVDRGPQAIAQMRPFYPAYARRRRLDGEVTVLFTVNAQGRTADIRVLESHPETVFAEAAVKAVERWRFTPAERHGVAVAVRVRQVIRFRMED